MTAFRPVDLSRSDAEEAARAATRENPGSSNPHGSMMRRVLSWVTVEEAISANTAALPLREAESMARVAFERLCELRPEYRDLRAYLDE